MGAALLKQPEKVKEILSTLVHSVSVPITCKIRILPTVSEEFSDKIYNKLALLNILQLLKRLDRRGKVFYFV